MTLFDKPGPPLAEESLGNEPSLRGVLIEYYNLNGVKDPEALADQYIEEWLKSYTADEV